MTTIKDIIYRTLPFGTDGKMNYTKPPYWPPDLFAVCARIATLSDCYSKNKYSGRSKNKNNFFSPLYRKAVRKNALLWANSKKMTCPKRVAKLWTQLLKNETSNLSDQKSDWQDAIIELISICDETCAGLGLEQGKDISEVVAFSNEMFLASLVNKKSSITCCLLVPPEEVCVQPKTLTSQVGCAIRSLTHHLALLPACSEVQAKWKITADTFSVKNQKEEEKFNLLLLPFPYHIDDSAFKESALISGDLKNKFGHFTVCQNWLPKNPKLVADFIISVLKEAEEKMTEKVHGIVLPELALDTASIIEVASVLKSMTSVEILISGLLSSDAKKNTHHNLAYTYLFSQHREQIEWYQAKHHRWKLDSSQIKQYKLTNSLSVNKSWWEEINIEDRSMSFYMFRPGVILTSLVCEDLARTDPVQPILKAIGPNLVVSLLQDGPQWLKRWPGRYATVLSDDPGSSVLTLTSLGMVERSMDTGDHRTPRTIALWKDQYSQARELDLPRGHHALLLNLIIKKETTLTLDGRSDDGESCSIVLNQTKPIQLPNPPKWLKI